MLEKLRALVKLAEIDASAHDLEEQLRGIPVELKERREAMNILTELVNVQKQQLSEAESLWEQQVAELKQRSESLAKSKSRGAKARNMREADAADRELQAIRRSIRDGETERDRLRELIENTKAMLEQPLKELEEQEQALREAEESSAPRLAELEAERDKVTAGRTVYAEVIGKKLSRRYDRVRQQLNPPVAEIKGGICQCCRMRIPSLLDMQIFRGDDIYQCPSCKRFVFHLRNVEA